jgi:hypothetical protein
MTFKQTPTINRIALLTTVLALLTSSIQVFGHHGATLYYDTEKPITLTGTVSQFLWSNPHVQIYIDVKNANGKVVRWSGELNSTEGMIRAGWNKQMVKAGDHITVTVFPAKTRTPISVIDQAKGVVINGTRLQVDDPTAKPKK